MGIAGTKFRGRMKIKGKPKEVAKAEIMLMKHREGYENRKRRRILFTFLDFVMIVSFGLAIYFVYVGDYIKVILFLVIASLPLLYFIVRRILKNKKKR